MIVGTMPQNSHGGIALHPCFLILVTIEVVGTNNWELCPFYNASTMQSFNYAVPILLLIDVSLVLLGLYLLLKQLKLNRSPYMLVFKIAV